MTNELNHTLLTDATNGIRIGETLFATARQALEATHQVAPLEVFLTSVVHTGTHVIPEVEAVIAGTTITLHNVEIDLQEIGKSLLTFSADSASATPLSPEPTTEPVAPTGA